jgi:hypothetical protein
MGQSAGIEAGNHHVGDDGTELGNVESYDCLVHTTLLQLLASAQQFGIDGTDLVEHAA